MILGVLSSLLIFQACCKLPFVDCGPTILPLEVSPKMIELDHQSVRLDFEGSRYISRRNNTLQSIYLECKVRCGDRFKVEFERTAIYYDTGVQKIYANDVTAAGKEKSENQITYIYNIQFNNINEESFKAIYIEGLPIVKAGSKDVNYFDYKINILK